jgi:DNA-binding transcriptional regulator YiaG
MPNLSSVLKSEISRISRKEVKSSVNPIRTTNISLKKSLAELKRKLSVLEAKHKRLLSHAKIASPKVLDENEKKARITSKNIKSLRSKLGLSQNDFAKLIGVSTQNVFALEHKEKGRLKLRSATLSNLLSLRGIGKREAKKKLEEIAGEKS